MSTYSSMTTQVVSKHEEKGGGFSLLLVVLVGSFMLIITMALADYAQRLVSSLQVRGEAVQDLYTAESAFECVKFWIRRDYRQFSYVDGGPSEVAVCNGYEYDFNPSSSTDTAGDGVDPEYSGNTGTFRIPFSSTDPNGAGVFVEVERDAIASEKLFKGIIRVYSQSNDASGIKTAERYQEYTYMILFGADIMFVVDTSGSIDADDGTGTQSRGLRSPGLNDWNKMLDAVIDSVGLLHRTIPVPKIGLLSYGTDASDTGNRAGAACSAEMFGSECNWREPDVVLTDDLTNLIDDSGPFDMPIMNNLSSDPPATNLSLAISIAGAELMGRYYPHSEYDLGTTGWNSGDFEKAVMGGQGVDFTDLPAQSPNRDSDDSLHPDVMVIVTDGAPNGIMSTMTSDSLPRDLYVMSVDNLEDTSTTPHLNKFVDGAHFIHNFYDVGDTMLFRTPFNPDGAFGTFVLDKPDASDPDQLPTPDLFSYQWCDDTESENPHGYFNSVLRLRHNYAPYFAMCNASTIADVLKEDTNTSDPNITIIGIYVNGDIPLDEDNFNANTWPIEAVWMHEYLVSETASSEKLFAHIDNYDELESALLYLFETLTLEEAR